MILPYVKYFNHLNYYCRIINLGHIAFGYANTTSTIFIPGFY